MKLIMFTDDFSLEVSFLEHREMFSYILICMVMESWTLSLFMAGPKSKLEGTRFVHKRRSYLAEIAEAIIAQRGLEKKVCLFGDTFT